VSQPTEILSLFSDTEDAPGGLWASKIADKVLAEFPDETLYTCAAGISPSGIVHFGNFRDVATSYAVMRELQSRGKKARLLFSWDDFDRYRKVPAGIPESFKQYIGMPLTSIPDPFGKEESYARHFEIEFELAMRELNIPLDYRYQTKEHVSGRYADRIAFVLQNRETANDILLQFMTEKSNHEKGIDPAEFRKNNSPVQIYSRFNGTDATELLSYDGGTKLTYRCKITNQQEQIDFKETPIVKLQWKFDWPMRWGMEQVHFEPGGKDHLTPGGSYSVSSVVSRELFKRKPPVTQMYEFVNIQGMQGKMSGSKGGAVSPGQLLEIYTPDLLKWLYMRRMPTQGFNLAFDSEVVRQYDEFDRACAAFKGGSNNIAERKVLEFSGIDPKAPEPMAFKQVVALGQITQWQPAKIKELAEKSAIPGSAESIALRLPKARGWLETYNSEEMIALRVNPNEDYGLLLDAARRDRITQLRDFLKTGETDITTLDQKLYGIPKDPSLDEKGLKVAQRAFFKDIYNLLISRDAGPRLSTFLSAVDREIVLKLLSV
jgi:lysyl-tRNA synthetase class 1